MSILTTLSWLWAHRPTPSTLAAVEAIGAAGKQFIEALEANLPAAAGRASAVRMVNSAVTTANLALAQHLEESGDPGEPQADGAAAQQLAEPS